MDARQSGGGRVGRPNGPRLHAARPPLDLAVVERCSGFKSRDAGRSSRPGDLEVVEAATGGHAKTVLRHHVCSTFLSGRESSEVGES